ncbi:MAG: MBOAT family O-acyltransferase, partial [Bacilli bacterium]
MTFNSIHFLIFLPIVILLYWLVPHKFRWVILLIASYYFYMSWNPQLVFLILGTTAVSYFSGILIEKAEKKSTKKLVMAVGVLICLGVLIFFKYSNFLMQSVYDFLNLFGMDLSYTALKLILPVGISFYTFQTLSYIIDVYRGTFKAERHFGYYALFVSYFPQLVAGPIERPGTLIPQLKEEHFLNKDDFLCGMRIMLLGFFRKCVISDIVGIFVKNAFANLDNANSLSMMVTGLLFLIQIYCDFAGYSEIATGVARMMGVKLTRNFDRPFLSQGFGEFFRRWHITLGRWLADYVYIPLGGNRKGTIRKELNMMIVFIVCGLWHGASWNYALWGLYLGVFICLEDVLVKPFLKYLGSKGVNIKGGLIVWTRRIITMILFIPASLIFAAEDVSQIGQIYAKLFHFEALNAVYFNNFTSCLGLTAMGGIFLAIALISLPIAYYY